MLLLYRVCFTTSRLTGDGNAIFPRAKKKQITKWKKTPCISWMNSCTLSKARQRSVVDSSLCMSDILFLGLLLTEEITSSVSYGGVRWVQFNVQCSIKHSMFKVL